jgi:hypothetical protein
LIDKNACVTQRLLRAIARLTARCRQDSRQDGGVTFSKKYLLPSIKNTWKPQYLFHSIRFILQSMKALIVEDNAKMRRMMADFIGHKFEKIYECADGSQALSLYETFMIE